MKNKKLLIAGVLAAFLMLAVPFAVASVDSEDSYAAFSGAGTESNPYIISSADDLEQLAADVNGGNSYEGKYFKLNSDIALSGEWTPIGGGVRDGKTYTGNSFKGIFNGNNNSISGLTITETSGAHAALGLFGVVDGGVVHNLILSEVNIKVNNSECAGGAIGLLVGGGVADNIEVRGEISAKRGNGGIVGRMTVSGSITECVNYATMTATGGANIGGIVSAAYYSDFDKQIIVQDCENYGSISSVAGGVGGIVGLSAANIIDCTNHASVIGKSASVGGIVGEQQNTGSIEGCTNYADVKNDSGDYGTGGIVGWVRYNGAAIDYPYKSIINVENNINYGSIDGGNDAGGIVGVAYNAANVIDNQNFAEEIKSTNFSAGIIGNMQFEETPVPGASGSDNIPNELINVIGNVSTTELESIEGSNKGLFVYDNSVSTQDGKIENNKIYEVIDGFAQISRVDQLTDALTDGFNIKLIDDIDVGNVVTKLPAFTVSRPTIIDGSNGEDRYSITATGSTDSRLFNISSTGEVVFKNISLEITGISTRGINVTSESNNVNVVLDNVDLDVGHYAINLTGKVKGVTTLNITNSTISAYAALNIWSAVNAEISDSTLNSENIYSGDSDDFTTIVVNDPEDAEGEPLSSYVANISLIDTVANASATGSALQNVINYRQNTIGNLSIKDSELNGSGKGFAVNIESDKVTTTVDGVLTIQDRSAKEIKIVGSMVLNGIIIDDGVGEISVGSISGDGYVTGSNSNKWVGANKLETETVPEASDGTPSIDSDGNIVSFSPQAGTTELADGLTVQLNDQGKDVSVSFTSGTPVSGTAIISVNELNDHPDAEFGAVYEIVIKGVESSDYYPIYITIPRENNGLEPVVTWIDEDGRPIEDMRIHSDDGTSVTFITTHNSLYKLSYTSSGGSAPGFTPGMGTVTEEASEGFSTADYATIAGIVIAVVMLIGLVCIVRRN